ncbi:MAG: DegT/DnrJ/EryC1/StrS family aminotransferase [Myxococcota bacterium]
MTIDNVPLLDTQRAIVPLRNAFCKTFARVLDSGNFILGEEVTALEKACADYIGVAHTLGVSSGTDALLLALMALDIGPGDEVICPTYTFFATAGTVARTGATPVFVDVSPVTWNVDPQDVARKITDKTKVIMPVHLFGQCADLKPVMELAKDRGIHVIEDAAQAIGAKYHGQQAGTFGDFGCFSFFPSKNLGAMGDAGLVTTQDATLAERARIMRTHGGKPKYYHGVIGGNFRIDALQAALIGVKLPHLDDQTQGRQQNAAHYNERFLASDLAAMTPDEKEAEHWFHPTKGKPATRPPVLLPRVQEERHIFNQYTLRLRDKAMRDKVCQYLQEKNIGHAIYYPVPMHLQPCFKDLGYKVGDFPYAEAAAEETVAIPIFPELTAEEIDYVVDNVVLAVRHV